MQYKYTKSTHFAAQSQYLAFFLQCLVFMLVLIPYFNQYNILSDIYSDWNQSYIESYTQENQTCPEGTNLLNYPFEGSIEGCYCGGDVFAQTEQLFKIYRLFAGACSSSQTSQNCKKIDPQDGVSITNFNGYLCGQLSSQTLLESYQVGVRFNKSLTINYVGGICYTTSNDAVDNYPLFATDYICDEIDPSYVLIQNISQEKLLKDNTFYVNDLVGYSTYQNLPNFGLYMQQFRLYNCTLPLLNLPHYRDNYIQNTNLVAIVISALLPGLGAISLASILARLKRKGISKTKVYYVNRKFYIPKSVLVFLNFITTVNIIVLVVMHNHIIMLISNFLDDNCTDIQSERELKEQRTYIYNNELSFSVSAVIISCLSLSYEIFQIIYFEKKAPKQPDTPKLELDVKYRRPHEQPIETAGAENMNDNDRQEIYRTNKKASHRI